MNISTPNVVVARFASALYDVALDFNTGRQVLAAVSPPNDINTFFNQLYVRDFNSMPAETVATTIATNLGLTGDAFDQGVLFLTGWLNGTPVGERGAVISQI
ncbi:hypothetical protein, partial [Candidatus Accumulibacter vicinus]|uniref:hypothetical protein n=1 Tax=Candidatus Accumulibacter vicinus TaxID=2954382 RepID=UPI000552D141